MFRKYRRTNIAEMREYVPGEILKGVYTRTGFPKAGDMIARDPANHEDQWLVTKEYFLANFEPVEG